MLVELELSAFRQRHSFFDKNPLVLKAFANSCFSKGIIIRMVHLLIPIWLRVSIRNKRIKTG